MIGSNRRPRGQLFEGDRVFAKRGVVGVERAKDIINAVHGGAANLGEAGGRTLGHADEIVDINFDSGNGARVRTSEVGVPEWRDGGNVRGGRQRKEGWERDRGVGCRLDCRVGGVWCDGV